MSLVIDGGISYFHFLCGVLAETHYEENAKDAMMLRSETVGCGHAGIWEMIKSSAIPIFCAAYERKRIWRHGVSCELYSVMFRQATFRIGSYLAPELFAGDPDYLKSCLLYLYVHAYV